MTLSSRTSGRTSGGTTRRTPRAILTLPSGPTLDERPDAPRAIDGRATAITVLTPIKPGRTPLERVVFFLGEHVKMLNKALEELSFIHYARWTIITGFPDNGPPQQHESLQYDYLFFETNFNGTWDEYIDAFSEIVPNRMSAIWGSSFGFPGPQPVGPFKAYIHANDLPIAHYYSAYPAATTKMVVSALAVRDAFEAFQTKTAGIHDADAFRLAYDKFVAEIQHEL
jgi:hypothetical protein